jgi:hypothetical protein
METFEVIVKERSYKIIRDHYHRELFNVFNHTTYYIIKKFESGSWVSVEHRFGLSGLPIDEIGDEIDKYYDYLAYGCLIKSLEQRS